MIRKVATNTNLRFWFDPTRARTHDLGDEHANHNTTDTVQKSKIIDHHYGKKEKLPSSQKQQNFIEPQLYMNEH
jgi:hypothetical protein